MVPLSPLEIQYSEEIDSLSFGSLESLLLARILLATQSMYEDQKEKGEPKGITDKQLAKLKKIFKSSEFVIESEESIMKILKELISWRIISPDYSVNVTFSSTDGEISVISGETRMEKPLVTFTASKPVEVPLMEDKIAAGSPLPISGHWEETRFFTESYLRRFTEPILIEVGKDQDSMIPKIFPGDLLLIDRKPVERPKKGIIYAVNLEEGGSVKYCQIKENKLYITCENKFSDFHQVELEMTNRTLNEVIVGEVVWVGRELSG
jgi:hypothetical protein